MIAYLTVCLFLSRRIRLYPLDFGPFLVYFYCFVHRVNLKFTPKIPTPFQHGNVKKLSGEGTPPHHTPRRLRRLDRLGRAPRAKLVPPRFLYAGYGPADTVCPIAIA